MQQLFHGFVIYRRNGRSLHFIHYILPSAQYFSPPPSCAALCARRKILGAPLFFGNLSARTKGTIMSNNNSTGQIRSLRQENKAKKSAAPGTGRQLSPAKKDHRHSMHSRRSAACRLRRSVAFCNSFSPAVADMHTLLIRCRSVLSSRQPSRTARCISAAAIPQCLLTKISTPRMIPIPSPLSATGWIRTRHPHISSRL